MPSPILMTSCRSELAPSGLRHAALSVALLLVMSLSPALSVPDFEPKSETADGTQDPWVDGGQPWPQAGRTSDRLAVVPAHGPDGGVGDGGVPEDASEFKSIVEPAVNWAYPSGSDEIGTDALSVPIADLSASITVGEGAFERCGGSSLFTILVLKDSESDPAYLRIIEGEDAELAWQVSLGQTEFVKAAPLVVDIDGDGLQEILIVYDDSSGDLNIEAWSPRLSCSVTGWSSSADSTELLWSWTDQNRFISNEGPYEESWRGYHKPTTQPLLADLDFDGDAELIIAAIEKANDKPEVIALDISGTGATILWYNTLSRGTHPSDPAFVQTDDSTGYVILTTIQDSTGSMWLWKLDHEDGGGSWTDGYSLGSANGGGETYPHVRLPGPVIANLDAQDDPEIILTIPTDGNGYSGSGGAEFIGMEIGNASEIWSFEASNGFADAPPTAVDTDGDGQHDRVCWVTWSKENTIPSHGLSLIHI